MEVGTVEYVSELLRSDIIGSLSLSIPCGGSLVARTDIDASGIGKQVSTVLKRENGVLGQLS